MIALRCEETGRIYKRSVTLTPTEIWRRIEKGK